MIRESDSRSAEIIGTRLGYLGLAPFVFCVVGALLLSEFDQFFLNAFMFYSVIILSFMGGVHWGLALVKLSKQASRLFLSTIPSLLGWLCLMLPSQDLSLAVLGGIYIAQWFVEKPILSELNVPTWYFEMRPRLAYIVAGCHLFIFFRLIGS